MNLVLIIDGTLFTLQSDTFVDIFLSYFETQLHQNHYLFLLPNCAKPRFLTLTVMKQRG